MGVQFPVREGEIWRAKSRDEYQGGKIKGRPTGRDGQYFSSG